MTLETPRVSGSTLPTTPVFASVVVALAAAWGSGAAWADDRPFLRTTSAVVEDDDERVFEFTATHVVAKKQRSTSAQLGYSFSPTWSVEMEQGLQRDRIEGHTEREQGLGLRLSWVDPAREGWGLATRLSVERERESGEEWTRPQWRGVMAFSLPLAGKRAWLHANLGARYSPPVSGSQRWAGLWSLAAQMPLSRRTALFAEAAGASDGLDRMVQFGVRQWLQREKVAIDWGWGRQWARDTPANFLAISLSLYDLSD